MTQVTRGKLSAILAAMFVVGAVVGSLAAVYGTRQPRPHKSIEERFAERLELTAQQREQLKPVFAQLSMDSRMIRSNSFCLMESSIEKANATIRPLLTEKQRIEFEKMNQERKEFMRPWRDRGGRDHDPKRGEKPDKAHRMPGSPPE